ncbi:MAG: bacitracin transporter permease BcrC [Parcubacteria group bacterium Gr01-1014_3]|nr:MAG: bacitracin transporter permease BcrC [Parcubacteria group bacterium Gr01-1014_3]
MRSIDLYLFNLVHDLAGASRLLDLSGIFLAKYLGYFLILATIAFLLSEKAKFISNSIFILLSLLLSRGLIAETIRFIYPRLRPFVALDFEPLVNHLSSPAFPSGHASFYFALAMALIVLNYRWKWWVLAAAIVMGVARIFAGAHWPLDILSGAIVGIFSVFVVKYLLPRPKE